LYERLTGRPAFAGGSVAEILAAVLHATPARDRLPADTPPGIRRLLRRCLDKVPKRRAELHSTDADFARFPGLRWANPVAKGRRRT
jgi:hypothetical protein